MNDQRSICNHVAFPNKLKICNSKTFFKGKVLLKLFSFREECFRLNFINLVVYHKELLVFGLLVGLRVKFIMYEV